MFTPQSLMLKSEGVCVCPLSYCKGIRQMVPVSDQDMNTHLAELSRVRTISGSWLVERWLKVSFCDLCSSTQTS